MANTIMIGAMAGAAMLLTGSAEAPIGAQVPGPGRRFNRFRCHVPPCGRAGMCGAQNSGS